MAGMTSGFVCPRLIGWILDNLGGTLLFRWGLVYYISAGLYFAGGIGFCLLGSAELQPWDTTFEQDGNVKETEKKKNHFELQSYRL